MSIGCAPAGCKLSREARPSGSAPIESARGFRLARRKAYRMYKRCAWADGDPLLRDYHDEEWGVPERDSRALWEKLMLDGFQAGLSWLTILRKREAFRQAFEGFDPEIVARFGEADVKRLLGNAGIVRSRAKIDATIGGARAYLAMRPAAEAFSRFVCPMAGGTPIC